MKPDFKDPKFAKSLAYIASTLTPIASELRVIAKKSFENIYESVDVPHFPRPDQQPIFFVLNGPTNISPPAGYGLCAIPLQVAQNTLGRGGVEEFAAWTVCMKAMEELRSRKDELERTYNAIQECIALDMNLGMTELHPYGFADIARSIEMDSYERNRAIASYFIHNFIFNTDEAEEASIRETLAFLQALYAVKPYGVTHVHLYKYGPKPLPNISILEFVRILL